MLMQEYPNFFLIPPKANPKSDSKLTVSCKIHAPSLHNEKGKFCIL